MPSPPFAPAAIRMPSPAALEISGAWTAAGLGSMPRLPADPARRNAPHLDADCTRITALDSVGAWVLQDLLQRLRSGGREVTPNGLAPAFAPLFAVAVKHAAEAAARPAPAATPAPGMLVALGTRAAAAGSTGLAFLSFIGETTHALGRQLAHPGGIRWRPILFNIRSAGFDALPIVGLLSFLLGIVVAYQGADQLRRYGAAIYVADLVGVSMLREFAPLITAIIVAGRSGSAWAAQIGSMSVSEEIDAMRTIGIVPMELLVLPKIVALAIALPLLTAFADAMGVLGGMLMADAQLGVGHAEFLDRIARSVSVTTLMVGIGKAPVFAAIIALTGCFEGFRTRGGADSVGRQTTRSVVESIFLVIVADAAFSVAFSTLKL